MRYHQITSDERYMIARPRRYDFDEAEIAEIVGRTGVRFHGSSSATAASATTRIAPARPPNARAAAARGPDETASSPPIGALFDRRWRRIAVFSQPSTARGCRHP